MMAGEFAAARAGAGMEPPEKNTPFTVEEEIAVYDRRWKRLASAMSDLQLEAVEAEVIWGAVVADKLVPLRKCVASLYVALLQHARSKGGQWWERNPSPEMVEQEDRLIYKVSDDPAQDPFTGEIASAVGVIEAFARPHLAP